MLLLSLLRPSRSFFQVPKKLLERLAAEGAMGGGDGGWDEDDSELVSDDAGPEVRSAVHCGALWCSRAGWQGAGCAVARVRLALPAQPRAPSTLTPGRLQDYLDDAAAAAAAAEEQPSTSGREPEEDAKWSAFDAMVESWLGGSSQPRVEVASYAEDEEGEGAASNVLCARCYSLRHYGCAAAGGVGRVGWRRAGRAATRPTRHPAWASADGSPPWPLPPPRPRVAGR